MIAGMSSRSWSEDQARAIGETIRALRGARSAQWLSDRTEELGNKVSRSTISEIETARRKTVTTAELIVLAAALKVPPLLLLFPGLPTAAVEYLPGDEVATWRAHRRFAGTTTNPLTAEDGVQLMDLTRLYGEENEWFVPVSIRHAANPDDGDLKESLELIRSRLTEIESRIKAIRSKLMLDGG